MRPLLTVEQIAEMLGVKESTIYQWTHEGFIPYVKLGRLVRFDEETVMEWVADRSTAGRKTRRVDVGGMGM